MNFKSLLVIFLLISSMFVSTQAVEVEKEQNQQEINVLGIGYSDWSAACAALKKDIALCLVYYQHCEWSNAKVIAKLVNSSLGIKKINSNNRGYNRNEPEIVYTSKGAIRGTIKDSCILFYGVPYAKPPINELRWENPVELKYWKYIKNTNQQKAQCPRICSNGDSNCNNQMLDTSEDCLYLDIFKPRDSNPNSKLPVLVYISDENTSDNPMVYDGTKFANSSIIFIKINYRLGVFGFLSTDLLNGNYGILDQIKALEWINENIESFGGDKNRVTIWGGISIPIHLISPYSKSLFNAAIISSAPLAIEFKDRIAARGLANRLVIKVGHCINIEDIDCLRSLTTGQLLEAQEKVRLQIESSKILSLDIFNPIWSPIIDGDIIPKQILTAVKDGDIHNVPIIIGGVQDEGIEFVYRAFESSLGDSRRFKKRIGSLYYSNYLSNIFPLTWKKVISKYPIAHHSNQDIRPMLSRIINDYLFKCSNRYFINQFINQNSESSIFNYNYQHIKSITHSISQSSSSSSSSLIKSCESYSCHGSDITLFFGSYDLVNEYIGYDEIKISNYLIAYISNFVKTNNPNQDSNSYDLIPSIVWNPITQIKNSTLIIDNEFKLLDNTLIDSKCDLFDTLYSKIK